MFAYLIVALAALLPTTLSSPLKTTEKAVFTKHGHVATVIKTVTYTKATPTQSTTSTTLPDLFSTIKPVTTSVAGTALVVSAFDTTCSFQTKYSATKTTSEARATNRATGCQAEYEVQKGDNCNDIMETYLYWNIDCEHLVLWNPDLGLDCKGIRVGMSLCLKDNQEALATETAATG